MDLSYYKLNAPQKFWYKLKKAFSGLPIKFANFFKRIYLSIISFFKGLYLDIKSLVHNFAIGDYKTKLSYVLMGFGHIFHGEIIRGILYLLVEIGYILFMVFLGGKWTAAFFSGFFTRGTIGFVETSEVWDEEIGAFVKVAGDNSFKLMLYGILAILITVFFVIIYFKSIREAAEVEERYIIGLKGEGLKVKAKEFLNNKFHISLLSLPMIGLFLFTIVPLITMIFIAFTNYDSAHEVPEHLFSWVGFSNFGQIFGGDSGMSMTFLRVLGWTLTWAFFATFTNYFFGMILAILINKKGIHFKKFFRTVFVTTIAVPQFVSLLIMSKMLDADGGIITQFFENVFGLKLLFGLETTTTRIIIIIVNMWIGIPYSMLICSGILMNIPQDLYESARIDGSSTVTTFGKITLPYMLFVTGPYLITQFIGNINNFNVIFLLSGGGPGDLLKYTNGAKSTDLLVTWLYSLSLGNDKNYKLASVIGIIVFIISATFSLIVYNHSAAVKKEDDFQ